VEGGAETKATGKEEPSDVAEDEAGQEETTDVASGDAGGEGEAGKEGVEDGAEAQESGKEEAKDTVDDAAEVEAGEEEANDVAEGEAGGEEEQGRGGVESGAETKATGEEEPNDLREDVAEAAASGGEEEAEDVAVVGRAIAEEGEPKGEEGDTEQSHANGEGTAADLGSGTIARSFEAVQHIFDTHGAEASEAIVPVLTIENVSVETIRDSDAGSLDLPPVQAGDSVAGDVADRPTTDEPAETGAELESAAAGDDQPVETLDDGVALRVPVSASGDVGCEETGGETEDANRDSSADRAPGDDADLGVNESVVDEVAHSLTDDDANAGGADEEKEEEGSVEVDQVVESEIEDLVAHALSESSVEGSRPIAEPSAPRRGGGRRPPSGPHELSRISAKFLNGQPVACDDPETLAVAVCELEDVLHDRMAADLFQESVKAAEAADAARGKMMESLKKRNQREIQQTLQSREEASQQAYDAFQAQMEQREAELEAELKEQMLQLTERQRQELDEHDESWMVEPKQRLYNRSSQHLRILRVQQQLLLSSHRFDEAAQVCGMADRVAGLEAYESHYQMTKSFTASRTRLLQRQAQEVDTMLRAAQVRRGEFRCIKETIARRFTNRFSALQVEERTATDSEKLWIKAHRHDGDQLFHLRGTIRTRTNPSPKTANVATFNRLALPPLPRPASARRPKQPGYDFRKTL
jgi:hypothetical protein